MAARLPYVLSTGLIPKILEKAEQAKRPDRFTQDFLETKLGHSGGGARPIIPLLKRMGFLGSDGTPTSLYDQFRNGETKGSAVAQGMRTAFTELFERNEYAYELTRDRLTSLVVEVTGGTKEESKTKGIVGTFWALKALADFEGVARADSAEQTKPEVPAKVTPPIPAAGDSGSNVGDNVDFKVSYTINLNLPETTDVDVFNAIFKALRENLLKTQ